MPEYVYALHDFLPEHEDEVPFRAGERVEVVEKDDLYGDGWWQGRNLAGHVGLFPVSYTAPAPPPPSGDGGLGLTTEPPSSPISPSDDSKLPLHTLAEETEPDSPPNHHNNNIIAPQPQIPAVFLNGNEPTDFEEEARRKRTTSGDGEVMKATMTDVQKAIEQLGRGRGANGDDRSFSFASSTGDHTDRETDTDMSDADNADNSAGEGWHKDARAKLAAKAKKAVEEAEKMEAMMGGYNRREVAPPIEAELSDESEPEDGEFTMHHSRLLGRRHSHIPEESEGEETDQEIRNRFKQASIDSSSINHPSTGADSTLVEVPDRDDTDAPTATKANFPITESPSTFTPAEVKTPENKTPAPAAPASPPRTKEEAPRSFSTPVAATPAPAPKPASPPPVQQVEVKPAAYRESMIALPSPTGSFPGIAISNDNAASPPPPQHQNFNKYMSVMSNYSVASAASDVPPVPSLPPSTQNSTLVDDKDKDKKVKGHPSDWTVEEVVEWLKSKGFDQDVCDKFTEQEIAGDVLLELDVNMLKTEIGIMAFGKRMRIANAITDLRRPPSVVYPDTPEQFSPIQPHPMMAHNSLTPSQSVSMTHSRSVSQSHSHNSFPGTYSYTQSVRSSLGSPMYAGPGFPVPAPVEESPSTEYVMSEAPSTERGASEYGMNIPQSISANGKQSKLRPAQLSLSPSDSALKVTAKAVSNIPEESEDEHRGHMSDGEVPKSIRHRIFRRSVDSRSDSVANSFHSKEGPPTPDKDIRDEKRTPRNKKSVDGKSGERLSIFGGSFGGGLGKGRKPAPKYSSANDETGSDRSSMFGRYTNRKSSGGTVTASDNNGTVKAKENIRTRDSAPAAPPSHKDTSEKEKDVRDPTVLRKRTASTPASPPPAGGANEVVSPLKQGQSILEQIGTPDYSGWMRKRGERYNSWKLRYFVLSGQHLYCLKSNSTSETKIKGYVNIVGYKVTVDENLNPGKYGFKIEHDNDKTHYFSSDEKNTVREWMKAIMKATIGRDYSKPVISSCNIPTIPLVVAQTMNPAPRPPSPGAREATQRALRRENPNQLSSRDARILMGLPATNDANAERQPLDAVFTPEEAPKSPVPPRPSRESRRQSISRTISGGVDDRTLIEWANSHLPESLQIVDNGGSPCGGLELLRIAESIKGRPSSPPVPDSMFPRGPNDDKLEGLFRLFDFLLDNDVKMGSVSINDIRQGKRDKIIQLLKALKAWEDKRRAIAQSIGGASSVQAAGFMAPVWS